MTLTFDSEPNALWARQRLMAQGFLVALPVQANGVWTIEVHLERKGG